MNHEQPIIVGLTSEQPKLQLLPDVKMNTANWRSLDLAAPTVMVYSMGWCLNIDQTIKAIQHGFGKLLCIQS